MSETKNQTPKTEPVKMMFVKAELTPSGNFCWVTLLIDSHGLKVQKVLGRFPEGGSYWLGFLYRKGSCSFEFIEFY